VNAIAALLGPVVNYRHQLVKIGTINARPHMLPKEIDCFSPIFPHLVLSFKAEIIAKSDSYTIRKNFTTILRFIQGKQLTKRIGSYLH
jgi:hypothetical protein